jgi:hypothetical protein
VVYRSCVCAYVCDKMESEKIAERERNSEEERERERETERETERDRERQRQRPRETETERRTERKQLTALVFRVLDNPGDISGYGKQGVLVARADRERSRPHLHVAKAERTCVGACVCVGARAGEGGVGACEGGVSQEARPTFPRPHVSRTHVDPKHLLPLIGTPLSAHVARTGHRLVRVARTGLGTVHGHVIHGELALSQIFVSAISRCSVAVRRTDGTDQDVLKSERAHVAS